MTNYVYVRGIHQHSCSFYISHIYNLRDRTIGFNSFNLIDRLKSDGLGNLINDSVIKLKEEINFMVIIKKMREFN